MPSNFAKALDDEIVAIEDELHADPRYSKLTELKRVRDQFYGSEANASASDPAARALHAIGAALNLVSAGRRQSPNRDRILSEAATLILASNGEPVPTSVIYERLVNTGINVPGEKPVNNLSAMLSNSGRFKAHKRRGWTIAEPRNSEIQPNGAREAEIADLRDIIKAADQAYHSEDKPLMSDASYDELRRKLESLM